MTNNMGNGFVSRNCLFLEKRKSNPESIFNLNELIGQSNKNMSKVKFMVYYFLQKFVFPAFTIFFWFQCKSLVPVLLTIFLLCYYKMSTGHFISVRGCSERLLDIFKEYPSNTLQWSKINFLTVQVSQNQIFKYFPVVLL